MQSLWQTGRVSVASRGTRAGRLRSPAHACLCATLLVLCRCRPVPARSRRRWICGWSRSHCPSDSAPGSRGSAGSSPRRRVAPRRVPTRFALPPAPQGSSTVRSSGPRRASSRPSRSCAPMRDAQWPPVSATTGRRAPGMNTAGISGGASRRGGRWDCSRLETGGRTGSRQRLGAVTTARGHAARGPPRRPHPQRARLRYGSGFRRTVSERATCRRRRADPGLDQLAQAAPKPGLRRLRTVAAG